MTKCFPTSAWTGRLLALVACLVLVATTARASVLDLAWDANAEPDVAGYLLSYGTASGAYTSTVDVGNTTTWSSTGLIGGQPYFFSVQAYNTAGLRSAASVELAATPADPVAMIAPIPGAALSFPATFQWSAGSGVARHWLSIGSAPGGSDLYDQNADGSSATLASLAASPPVYYVRLWSKIGLTWYLADYTYTSARPTLHLAGVSSLEGQSGSQVVSFTVTLSATAAAPVTVQFATANGTATAGSDYTATTGTLTIPAGVSTGLIPVTILGDTVSEADETFSVTLSAVSANAALGTAQATGTIRNDDSAAPAAAQLTYPAAGAVNADLTQVVRWTPVANVQAYYLYVGSTLGANDLVNTGEVQTTSYLATGLPGGQTLFARLWTKSGGLWRSTDSQFSARASAPVTAVLTVPVNGATAVDPARAIQWTAIAGVQAYYLYVGSTVGAKNLIDSHEIQPTSYAAATLPAGQTVFARLWTKTGGAWRFTDSTFTVR